MREDPFYVARPTFRNTVNFMLFNGCFAEFHAYLSCGGFIISDEHYDSSSINGHPGLSSEQSFDSLASLRKPEAVIMAFTKLSWAILETTLADKEQLDLHEAKQSSKWPRRIRSGWTFKKLSNSWMTSADYVQLNLNGQIRLIMMECRAPNLGNEDNIIEARRWPNWANNDFFNDESSWPSWTSDGVVYETRDWAFLDKGR